MFVDISHRELEERIKKWCLGDASFHSWVMECSLQAEVGTDTFYSAFFLVARSKNIESVGREHHLQLAHPLDRDGLELHFFKSLFPPMGVEAVYFIPYTGLRAISLDDGIMSGDQYIMEI